MENFLYVIPDDIHDRIAYHLFSSIECEEDDFTCRKYSLCDKECLQALLAYARIGSFQRRAVLRAISWRLCITEFWRPQTVLDYIFLSADELLELDIFEAPRFTFSGNPPTLLKLQKAIIDTLPEQLSLVFGSPELTELGVVVTSIRHWDSVLTTIASLPLEVLNLAFPLLRQNGIAENELKDLSLTQLYKLCAACPGVENFFLNPGKCPVTADAWAMIKTFPALKRLGLELDNHIDHAHEPFIRSLSELELYSAQIEEAQRFGGIVTALEVPSVSYGEQILGLTSLSNLRRLEITLGPGSERALASTIDNIEQLSLSWCFDYEGNLVEGLDDLAYPIYYEPDGAVLNNILKGAWKLKELNIEQAIISSDVMERILQNVGDRLENLALCFDWQNESAPERMKRTLRAISRNCPKLKSLNFLENSSFVRFPVLASEEERRRCLIALEELTSALPGFESHRVIRYIIEHRFTDKKPENMLLWHDILPDSIEQTA